LKNIKKIHFIGIGGAGMFALACIAIEQNFLVSGSDSQDSCNIQNLKKRGIKVYVGHDKKNIDNPDLVVYSGAIKKDNLEFAEAIKNKIKLMTRSQFLSKIFKRYKNSIAVSGSHGKTTTTSMITQILFKFDPTVIVGAYFKLINGNSRIGNSDFVVCEACEYLDSFLDLEPNVGVILNIDNDHLDYFKNLENEINSFGKFAEKCNVLVINKDDKNSVKATNNFAGKKIFYSLESNSEFMARNIQNLNGNISFDVSQDNNIIFNIKLKIPGKHNVYNALAAIAVCNFFGLENQDIKSALEVFSGPERRLETISKINGITIMDDFAHHPTEIEASLKAVTEMNFNRILLVFQPHTFSRTYLLMNDFIRVFSSFNLFKIILTDILPIREKNIYKIKSEDLASKIPNCICLRTFERIAEYLAENSKSGDLVLTMGGGDIYKCARMILEKQISSENLYKNP
jgi:UDP-N-acetylmuramate--alanine ligase